MPLLADHFSIILYLLAPLYWIWDSPKTLLTIQTIALGLGALPIYAITRMKTGKASFALAMAVVYLIYPAMEWTNAFEFHPETLGTPMLLAAFYYLYSGKSRWYFLMILLTAFTKETAGLVIIMLGCYALLVRRWRIGVISIGFGAMALTVALATIRYFNHGQPSQYWSLYSAYGNNMASMTANFIHHPIWILRSLDRGENKRYLIQLLEPLVFLPLLAPEVSAVAIPALMANMLSGRSQMTTIYYHYTAFITPILFVAAIVGLERWAKWGNRMTTGAMLFLLFMINISTLTWSPLWNPNARLVPPISPQDTEETIRMIRCIPPTASVAADLPLVSHLDHRTCVYLLPNPFYPIGYGNNPQALNLSLGDESPFPTREELEKKISSSKWTILLCILPQSRFCHHFMIFILPSRS